MKKIKVLALSCLILASLTVSALAITGTVKNIQAQIRGDITVNVDGVQQTFKTAQGKVIEPISYNGSTYLPVRAIGELMGKTVTWTESTKVIDLDGKAVTLPEDITDADNIVDGGTETAISAIAQQATALEKEINGIKKLGSYAENKKLFAKYEGKIELLDNQLDKMENDYEYQYDTGKLERKAYVELERQLDVVDNQLSKMDDTLENILGIDD